MSFLYSSREPRLYKRMCPSAGPSIGWSVGLWVHWSVGPSIGRAFVLAGRDDPRIDLFRVYKLDYLFIFSVSPVSEKTPVKILVCPCFLFRCVQVPLYVGLCVHPLLGRSVLNGFFILTKIRLSTRIEDSNDYLWMIRASKHPTPHL